MISAQKIFAAPQKSKSTSQFQNLTTFLSKFLNLQKFGPQLELKFRPKIGPYFSGGQKCGI